MCAWKCALNSDALRRRHACALLLWLAAACVVGCATSSEWVKVRDTPKNPLAGTLDLLSPGGPKPTPRTMQLLRRYDLAGELKGDQAALLARLEEIQRREPNREHEYAMAEIAYITASQSEKMRKARALEFYGTALIHAYRYLFEQDEVLAAEPVRSAIPRGIGFVQPVARRHAPAGPARRRAAARHVADHQNRQPYVFVLRRDARHRLAPGRHRPVAVRQRLQSSRVTKPLPHLRPGRAADRLAEKARRPGPGRTVLSAERLFSTDRLSARRCTWFNPSEHVSNGGNNDWSAAFVARACDHRPNGTAFRAGAVRSARPPVDRQLPAAKSRWKPISARRWRTFSISRSFRMPTFRRWVFCVPATRSRFRACTCSSRSTRKRCRSSWSTACGRARSPGWRCTTTCAATRSFGSTTSSGSTCIRPASRSGRVPLRCARTWR